MDDFEHADHDALIRPGTGVEVRNHFCAMWCHGFEVAETTPGGYRVLRLSDHYVLPVPFPPESVRAA